ncbi:hypothetical protein Val02_63010 [Virgisporangium aliadipatigenens]|uniref:Uncharacterized protein n=1 Tax=Virgisporangium aliadipatigenens TaxID=741659 RepID=A0A8J3YT51_9ACTN|nr:hypothetical protein [Virgisporangium aliadipatigenens]GIJ49415.1 hypothetical protein Val02_63010 [Virgisporangium aliadipatigenens]
MAYRVGVVQNENELLRYSYADVRQLLSSFDYEVKYFTGENIASLGSQIERLDSLVIATNACNDAVIRAWLDDNGERITDRVKAQRLGMLVLFQMALSDDRRHGPFPFLKDPFVVTGRKLVTGDRSARLLEVAPSSSSHPILRHPTRISVDRVNAHCMDNPNVPGLCWGYLDSFSADVYSSVAQLAGPASERKDLLLATDDPAGPRVIVSALVLDWQRHDELFGNCVRFVTEGSTPVALLKRRGTDSFELDLAEHVLRDKKIPIAQYVMSELSEWTPEEIRYGAVLLDPAWPEAEAKICVDRIIRDEGHPPVHYFSRLNPHRTLAVSVSRENDYQLLSSTAQLWLQTQYNGGLWDNSFWATVDVLAFFSDQSLDLSPYRDAVLEQVAKHLQPDGSYDGVFGATCAALNVMYWLGEDGPRYAAALGWVKSRAANQNLYNRATAADLLSRIAPDAIPSAELSRVRQGILQNPEGWASGLETLRYMRTLIALGEFEHAQRQVEKLRPAAAGQAEWLTVFGAAETVGILLDLYQGMNSSVGSIKQLLFSGLAYILDEYDSESGSWRQQTAATAKAALALARFAKIVDPAIGQALLSIADRRARRLDLDTLDRFRQKNHEMLLIAQATADSAAQAGEDGRQSSVRLAGARRLSVTLFIFGYLLLIALAVALIPQTIGWEGLHKWATDWKELSIPLGLLTFLAPVYIGIRISIAFGGSPRWLTFLETHLPRLAQWLKG